MTHEKRGKGLTPRTRGFLGPIGDDIPSIFPIVFGVLLFAGAMVYSLNQLNQRDSYLDVRKATLDLSYTVMESGYISDAAFNSACTSSYIVTANREGIRALVTVKKYCPVSVNGVGPLDLSAANPDNSIFNVGTPASFYASRGLYCSSENAPKNAVNYYVSNPQPKDYVVLNYPVAVDCSSQPGALVGVGMVNVIGWQSAN
jgi:hypothetical protein